MRYKGRIHKHWPGLYGWCLESQSSPGVDACKGSRSTRRAFMTLLAVKDWTRKKLSFAEWCEWFGNVAGVTQVRLSCSCSFFVSVFSNKVSQSSMLRKGLGRRTPAVDEEWVRDRLGVLDPYKSIEPDRLHLRMLRKVPLQGHREHRKSIAVEGKYSFFWQIDASMKS